MPREPHQDESTQLRSGLRARLARQGEEAFGLLSRGGEDAFARLTRQGEDAFGRLVQELLEHPRVGEVLSRAFDAREKAVAVQETAMAALNLPSSADLERLTRRLRSVSQRIEGIEEGLALVEQRLGGLDARLESIEQRLGASGDDRRLTRRLGRIERQLDDIAARLARLGDEAGAGDGDAAAGAGGAGEIAGAV